MIKNKLTLIGATLGSALTMLAAPAIAESVFVTGERQELLYRHIKYGDLNLASAEDQKVLRTRVGGAIRGLCLDVASFERSVRMGIYLTQCKQSAWSQARPQMDRAIGSAHRMAALSYPAAAAAVISIRVQPR